MFTKRCARCANIWDQGYETMRLFLIKVVLMGMLIMASGLKAAPSVVFLNPGVSDRNDPTGGFWLNVSDFMQAVADDLGIELEIIYAERQHLSIPRNAVRVLQRERKPDFLMTVNEMNVGGQVVELAESAGVPLFLINNQFYGEQKKTYGTAREHYDYWIGSLIPDNYFAGYVQARILIGAALANRPKGNSDPVGVVALLGDHATQAARERARGLMDAIEESGDRVILHQAVTAFWSRDVGFQKTRILLRRYPDTQVIWAANDPIALGAIAASVDEGRSPGRDLFVGGINWDKAGLEKIIDGEMAVSLGGHFMTGGWALIMLYDYYHGVDFASEGFSLKRPIFGIADISNASCLHDLVSQASWRKINFRSLSKKENSELKQYSFSSPRCTSSQIDQALK